MTIHAAHMEKPLGADLRALRKSREMTLVDMANRLGRSVGWLSQVERDKSHLSVRELHEIANVLNVPVSIFSAKVSPPATEAGFIVRGLARRAISKNITGLAETLLSPDLTDDFEMIHSVFAPGHKLTQPVQRPTQEVAYLISGRLQIWIEDQMFEINPGDSFRVRGEKLQWANPFDEPAIAIWVIAPPVY